MAEEPRDERWLMIALIVSGALFMELLDGTVISTALPQMARSFGENPVNVSVGMTAYLLTLAVFIPASGWVADRYGARTVFGAAIAIFTTASVVCALCVNLPEFTAARILQGVGGAMMVPVGRLVVLRRTSKRDLLQAMTFITTPGLIAPVIGPAVGGFITTFASWRWIFLLNVPLGCTALVLVALYMRNDREPNHRPFDPLGFVLSGGGLAILMYGLDALGRGEAGWSLPAAALGAGAVLAVLAAVHARRHAHPMLDLGPLQLPTFATATIWGGLTFRLVIGSQPLLWPLLFQVGMGMSAFQAGLLILVSAGGDVATKSFVNATVRRFGFRNLLTANAVAYAVLTLAFVAVGPGTPLVPIVTLLLAVGVVRSLIFTGINTLAYTEVRAERMSGASTLLSTIQQLSMGIAVAFGALTLRGAAFLHGSRSASFALGDLHLTFAMMSVVALLAAVSFRRLRPDAGVEVSGHRAPQTQRA